MVYVVLQKIELRRNNNNNNNENNIATVARFNIPPDSEEEEDIFAEPDVEAEVLWATRLYDYTKIWGHPWTLQLKAMLLEPLEYVGFYERFFYFIHIEPDVKPISQVTVLVRNGVGIVGNVWTSPDHRRRGCLKEIMSCVKDDFKKRKWKALYLGTGFNSLAYQIYMKLGWHPIEMQSGYMEYYGEDGIHDIQRSNQLRDAFEKEFFCTNDKKLNDDEIIIEYLGWQHYPVSVPLFLSGNVKGIIRSAPLNLMGRISPELPFIELIHNEIKRIKKRDLHQVQVLTNTRTNALVGFAMWQWEPNYKNTVLIDCFCHQKYWDYAPALLAGLPLPRKRCEKFMVLADWECYSKIQLFESKGFKKKEIGYELPMNMAKTKFTRMVYMEKINLEYVPSSTNENTKKKKKMTQKEKFATLNEQFQNMKSKDDLKNMINPFEVTDEEARDKVLDDDLEEMADKLHFLNSDDMPGHGYMSKKEVEAFELNMRKTVGTDPVDIFENSKPSSEISIFKPQEELDSQVKSLSLLKNQTGRREEELKQVELNSEKYKNAKVEKDPDGDLNRFGGIRENMDEVMRKYTEMAIGGDEEMAKNFIEIQREYENNMGDAHKQFEKDCEEIQAKYEKFLKNKIDYLFEAMEAEEEDIDLETQGMLKDMKETMEDIQNAMHDIAEEEHAQHQTNNNGDTMSGNEGGDTSSDDDDDDNDDENDNNEGENYFEKQAMKAIKKLKETTKSLVDDPEEYDKFRQKILKENGFLVDDKGEIIAQVMAPPNLDELIDEETGERLPSRAELYGDIDKIKTWKDMKSFKTYAEEMTAKSERRKKIAEEKRKKKESEEGGGGGGGGED